MSKRKPKPNYRRDYVCTGCGDQGLRLWRQYQTCANAVDLFCCECATKEQRESPHASFGKNWVEGQFFDYSDGDQIGWLVPAVPTEDGSTFWGYTSVDAEGMTWWQGKPTYRNILRELVCLNVQLQKKTATETYLYKQLEEHRQEVSDLKWKIGRKVYRVVAPALVTMWGTKRVPLGDGEHELRFGANQPRQLAVNDMLSVYQDRVLLILGESLTDCPQITSFEPIDEQADLVDAGVIIAWLREHHVIVGPFTPPFDIDD